MDHNKHRILVVEDNTYISEMIFHCLSTKGYFVSQAYNGLHALTIVENEQYDLALIDIQMPGLNGIETLSLIKSKHPSIKAIIMSANLSLSYIHEAMAKGSDAVLNKPFEISQLYDLRPLKKIVFENQIKKIDFQNIEP